MAQEKPPMTDREMASILRHYAATPWQMPGPGLLLAVAKRLDEVQDAQQKAPVRRRTST